MKENADTRDEARDPVSSGAFVPNPRTLAREGGGALLLLYAVYRQFHEGERIIADQSDEELLDLAHSWLANEGYDPYVNEGPKRLADIAEFVGKESPPFWAKAFEKKAEAISSDLYDLPDNQGVFENGYVMGAIDAYTLLQSEQSGLREALTPASSWIGERITVARLMLGLSRADAAYKFGCSSATWAKWERGHETNAKHLQKLAETLGVSERFLTAGHISVIDPRELSW